MRASSLVRLINPRWLVAAAALVALVLAVAWWPRSDAPETAPADPPDVKPGWSVSVVTDPGEVFRRALWRRPAEDDRIVHAERVEWSEPGAGVAKWQWHLVVEPGPALKEWLVEQNAFSLQLAADPSAAPVRRPAWFPASVPGAKVLRRDNLTVMLSADGQRLYASDTGHGFAPAHAAK